MDDRRFDALVRGLATGQSRRSVLKSMLGLGGATLAGLAASGPANAARRPTPTPKPVKCLGKQTWNGSACVCTSGTACGRDCCTGSSVCCDNACCDGDCYGEELCCPTGQAVCPAGGCCAPGAVCDERGECCTPDVCGAGVPDAYLQCGERDDGCGGTLTCSCPENWICMENGSDMFCANLTATCVPGLTAAAYDRPGLCSQGTGFCADTVTGDATVCASIQTFICTECASDADCGQPASATTCVHSWTEMCETSTMCAALMTS